MMVLYEYDTGRIRRNKYGDVVYYVGDWEDRGHSTRLIDLAHMNSMDIAYVMLENELAKIENMPGIEETW